MAEASDWPIESPNSKLSYSGILLLAKTIACENFRKLMKVGFLWLKLSQIVGNNSLWDRQVATPIIMREQETRWMSWKTTKWKPMIEATMFTWRFEKLLLDKYIFHITTTKPWLLQITHVQCLSSYGYLSYKISYLMANLQFKQIPVNRFDVFVYISKVVWAYGWFLPVSLST